MKKASLLLAGILTILLCLQASGGTQQGQANSLRLPILASTPSPRVHADYGKIPLQFIPNRGQTDERVAYYVQGAESPSAPKDEISAFREGRATKQSIALEMRTNVYGFKIGEYEHRRPLVLEPAILVYCGYIGGSSWDSGSATMDPRVLFPSSEPRADFAFPLYLLYGYA